MQDNNPPSLDEQLPSIHANEIRGIDCPACGHPCLMLFDGYITCTLADCPNPDYSEALKALFAKEVAAGKVSELKHWQYPNIEMIPSWTWPCHMCGFDAEKLNSHVHDRIAELTKELGDE